MITNQVSELMLINEQLEAVKEIVMRRRNWLFSVSKKRTRKNTDYQILIKTTVLNHLSLWKYLEWLLTEIKKLKTPSKKIMYGYYHDQQKYKNIAKLRSSVPLCITNTCLNAIKFLKMIAYQALWCIPTILSKT